MKMSTEQRFSEYPPSMRSNDNIKERQDYRLKKAMQFQKDGKGEAKLIKLGILKREQI